jgi:hypothetical protein
MEDRKILIIKCTDPLRWYVDKVGELVPFLGDVGNEYKSREPSGCVNFVQYEDAEIVEPVNDSIKTDNSKVNAGMLARIVELEKECEALTEGLLETENNLASLQSRFEDIEAVFCDEDGCLIIEPFNGEGLSKWFKGNKLEHQN